MPLRRLGYILYIIGLCIAMQVQAQGISADTLAARLDTLIKYSLPEGSNIGISIYDLTDNSPVYNYQADKLCRPASTMKLLTAITALAQPQAKEPFRTEVWYNGVIERDTLFGDLYIIGGFDPELDDVAMDSLVRCVANLPMSAIKGMVYGDVSVKDSLYWGDGWIWNDNPSAFQPYLSPLMFCKGMVSIEAQAGASGDTATIVSTPVSSYYTLINETCSQNPSAGKFTVSRNWLEDGNTITVRGNVKGKMADEVNVSNSQDFFMHTFVERLLAQGIACNGQYGYQEWVPCESSVQVATYETPLSNVLLKMLKESDNLNAEAMLWRIGRQCTGKKHIAATDGLVAINRLIRRSGLNPASYQLADGCGLSNYTYITPQLLVALLQYAHARHDIFQPLYRALPVSGTDGTLRNRMKGSSPAFQKIRAKTGSMTAICNLAGYAVSADKHLLAFAIMQQNHLSNRKARAFQDAVCEQMVKYCK